MATRWRRRAVPTALVAALTFGGLATPAGAAGNGAMQISGVGFGVDTCATTFGDRPYRPTCEQPMS